MSNMKGGFSTLNRWFGRKKDKSGVGSAASNGKLSKSTTQLHHMSTDTGMHINEASQLDYNRITPLPAATSNAPFEQTFRITVLLPKDQLYVTRLGARVPLSKLLSLVCDNKQLDADKYEFRNPVDASQVYSCESSIGAVGLSEIRLCHKSESYDSFNADSMLKFQRTAGARDSLSSSSDFSSSRHSHSKLTAKTPSPYSSSNSLNSMDSTGMNYTRTPVVPPKALSVAPPPRKKRVAPRPPSQLAIPEQSVPQFKPTALSSEPAYAVIVKRPQLCMSTPNLASTPEQEAETEGALKPAAEPELELDCNGNSAKTPDAADGGHYATLERKPQTMDLPEPTPRKRLMQLKKKTAPAPPPSDAQTAAGSALAADSISLASTTASITASITDTLPATPQPAPRMTTPTPAPVVIQSQVPQTPPTPTLAPLLIQAQVPQTPPPPLPISAAPQLLTNGNQNVSKVLLNRTPTPEPRSLGSATEEEDNNDAASKQADSGIGEPAPSSSPSPEPEREVEPEPEPELEPKSHIESSSDDDEAIKVYNFKTSCQTFVKAEELPAPKTLAELTVLTGGQSGTEDELGSDEQPSPQNGPLATPNSASELTSLSSWNYAGPISPPPDFSDLSQAQAQTPALHGKRVAGSPLNEIVDELSTIIQQQRLDTLIRQPPEQTEIEAAKPNRLANFSIASIGNGNGNANGNGARSSSSSSANSPTITRADSFQAIGQSPRSLSLGLRLRSSSQLSLNNQSQNQSDQQLQQRRSSSELSIGESPSLQSLELIKNILSNSRKNSLADSTDSAQQPQQQLLETSEKPKSRAATPPSAVKSRPATEVPTAAAASEPEPASVSVSAPLPPTYRYSGPPSINFATWSERPKSQVAIKNEGDYIFGGAAAASTPTTPAVTPAATPAATPAKMSIEMAAPILRMGIPRKEYHVPITVKPLRDASEERQNENEQTEQPQQPQQQKEQQLKEPLRAPVKPSTLPRPAKSNRFTLPAGGVQVSAASTTSSNSLPRPLSTLDKAPLRLTTTTPTSTTPTEPLAAPFGQNTLRRTGFKERMLAKEQQEKEQALRVRVSVNGKATPTPTPTPTHTVTATVTENTIRAARSPSPSPPIATATEKPTLASKTFIRSSKLELKLQQQPETNTDTETVTVTATDAAAETKLQVKLRPTSLMAIKPTATPAPPTPPALPVLAKAKPMRKVHAVTPTSPDPRTQLLDAIRNFKRDELNRA